MDNSGWISLHRKIMDHEFYNERRVFSKFEAWIDILLNANHKDGKLLIGNTLYEYKRGDSLNSLLTWAKRWNWDRSKVRRFLNLLQELSMVCFKCDSKTTHLTVINYDTYQDVRTSNEHHLNIKRTSNEHHLNTDNNVIKKQCNNEIKGKCLSDTIEQEKKNNKILIAEIIEYLNLKTSRSYKPDSKSTLKHINARINEKYKLEDFKKVIDNKSRSWKGDPEMDKFLRPETLFGNKFESYLNERQINGNTIKNRNGASIGGEINTIKLARFDARYSGDSSSRESHPPVFAGSQEKN